jgi:hypothetical protein
MRARISMGRKRTMIFLILWLAAIVGAAIHVSLRRLWAQPLPRTTLLLLYQLCNSFGLAGVVAFAGHALRPVETAARIGWAPNPNFQFELGSIELGMAIASLLSAPRRIAPSDVICLAGPVFEVHADAA